MKRQAQNGPWNVPRTQRDSQDRRWALSPLVLLGGSSDPSRLAPWRPSVTGRHRIPAPSSRNTELCLLPRTAVCKPGQTSRPVLHPCSPRLGTGPVNGAVQAAASGTPLVGPRLRLHLSMQGAWVRSLLGELRSCVLHGRAREEERERECCVVGPGKRRERERKYTVQAGRGLSCVSSQIPLLPSRRTAHRPSQRSCGNRPTRAQVRVTAITCCITKGKASTFSAPQLSHP